MGKNFNRYKYGLNNPYKYTDPDGRQEKELRTVACGTDTTCRISSGQSAGTINGTIAAARGSSFDKSGKVLAEGSSQNGASSALARVVQGGLGGVQIVGAAGQISTGARLCVAGYGAGCLIGLPFIVHGAGNAADGVGTVANSLDGGDRDWNFARHMYVKYINREHGGKIHLAIDTIMGGAALARQTRIYYNPATPFITGSARRSAAAWNPGGTLIVDGTQAANTFYEEVSDK